MLKVEIQLWVLIFFLGFGHIAIPQPNEKILNDSLLSGFQQITIEWPKTEWFGKSKISLGDYGNAIYKTGITSTDQKNIKGVTYTRIKYKFSVNLITKDSVKVELKGKVREDEGYVLSSGGITGFVLEQATGIQTENFEGVLKGDKTITADIILNDQSNEIWSFKRYISSIEGDEKLESNFLSHEYQFIEIVPINTYETQEMTFNSKGSYSNSGYEFFIDNTLVAVAESGFKLIWFKSDLDKKIKGLLTAVILSL